MDYQSILAEIENEIDPFLGKGQVADYIPALSEADPRGFAMSVIDLDGGRHAIGQRDAAFSIQSISKVFALALALSQEGASLWERVWREPSGTAFNSIVQLEREKGVPRNPFVNAGAMVVTDTIMTQCAGDDASAALMNFVRGAACDQSIAIDEEVAQSEKKWGDRNRSLAYFMKSFGTIKNAAEDVLDAYFKQCAIEMTTEQLACAGLFLANDGVNPQTDIRVASHDHVNRINALMLTCGHYDNSGDFAFSVGLPGKSGVGGGILCIVPRHCAVAVWSPGLNEAGNSLAGSKALEMFSEKTELNIF